MDMIQSIAALGNRDMIRRRSVFHDKIPSILDSNSEMSREQVHKGGDGNSAQNKNRHFEGERSSSNNNSLQEEEDIEELSFFRELESPVENFDSKNRNFAQFKDRTLCHGVNTIEAATEELSERDYTYFTEQQEETSEAQQVKHLSDKLNEITVVHEQDVKEIAELKRRIKEAEDQFESFKKELGEKDKAQADERNREIELLTEQVQISETKINETEKEKEEIVKERDELKARETVMEEKLQAMETRLDKVEEDRKKILKEREELQTCENSKHEKLQKAEMRLIELEEDKKKALRERDEWQTSEKTREKTLRENHEKEMEELKEQLYLAEDEVDEVRLGLGLKLQEEKEFSKKAIEMVQIEMDKMLKEAKAELEEIKKRVNDKDEDLRYSIEEIVKGHDSEIEQLENAHREQLDEHDEEVEEMRTAYETEINRLQQQIQLVLKERDDKDDELRDCELEIRELEDDVEEKEMSHEMTKKNLQNMEHALMDKEREIDALQEACLENEKIVSILQERAKNEMDGMKAEVSQKEEIYEDTVGALENANEMLSNKINELEAENNFTGDKVAALTEKHREVAENLKDKLTELDEMKMAISKNMKAKEIHHARDRMRWSNNEEKLLGELEFLKAEKLKACTNEQKLRGELELLKSYTSPAKERKMEDKMGHKIRNPLASRSSESVCNKPDLVYLQNVDHSFGSTIGSYDHEESFLDEGPNENEPAPTSRRIFLGDGREKSVLSSSVLQSSPTARSKFSTHQSMSDFQHHLPRHHRRFGSTKSNSRDY